MAARPDLPEAEKSMLLGWRNVVEGIFEVVGHDEPAVVVENLLDELTYRVRSNVGAHVFRPLLAGSYIIARLEPAGEEWLTSGTIAPIEARHRESVFAAAAELAMQHPEFVFRNPAKLARAWELQNADRDRFVRYFGADMIVIPGTQLADLTRDFAVFSRREVLAGLPPDETTRWADSPPPVPDFPPALADSESVAVIYDEVEGLSYFGGFAEFEQAFADPRLLGRRHRQRVREYLDDDSVSPLPFRRLGERDPDRASEVLRRVLGRKRFDWRHDGERLMRQRKPWYFEHAPLPRVLPFGERLAPFVGRTNG